MRAFSIRCVGFGLRNEMEERGRCEVQGKGGS